MSYRYTLSRVVGLPVRGVPACLLFVMLNPSTADEHEDDPTIRRCVGFAARECAARLAVVNLYAYRATDPSELARASWPVGPENDETLLEAMRAPDTTIVCAWGAHAMAERALERFQRLHKLAGSQPLTCLGRTKSGAPRHPLYVRADAALEPFSIGGVA